MVTLGFIVEGHTEKVLINSERFRNWANTCGITICSQVFNAGGGGNLLPHNIEDMVIQLNMFKPDHIVILTDQEDEPSRQAVIDRIGEKHTDLVFVAVKAIEAWFLADNAAMKAWLEIADFFEEKPEETTDKPWSRLREIAAKFAKRGPGDSKPRFAQKMMELYGFSIANAAAHPACPSAKEFHDCLVQLGAATGNGQT